MNNATKKRLNDAMKRDWEYHAETYTFNSWEEVDGQILIATDKKTLDVDLDDLDMFLAGLIEVGAKKNGHSETAVEAYQPIILQTISKETQSTVAAGLLSTFEELTKAQTPEKIKALSLKASNQVKIVGALTGMAKLELDLYKTARSKKSNKS